MGFLDSVVYLFQDYGVAVAAGVVCLSLFSTIFRIWWEIH